MLPLSRFGSLLTIGVLLAQPLAAQSHPFVQHVLARGSGQGVEVEIQTSDAITPQSLMISGPDRVVIDFPGALPGAGLHAVNVNQGPLKAIRTGLFSANPPITRVVLDLFRPQSYQIFVVRNVVMLKLGPGASATSKTAGASSVPPAGDETSEPPPPLIDVTFQNGLLRIHAERVPLARVLFEVQQKTGAELAIPAGAESEEIAADLGPAPARDVLASLLNGSRYNFIFIGTDHGRNLQKAILTLR